MILSFRRLGPIVAQAEIWFARRPNPWLAMFPVRYIQAASYRTHIGYFHSSFATAVVNLQRSNHELFEAMEKGTKYEIRRAEREGLNVKKEPVSREFVRYYNNFAAAKGIGTLSLEHIQSRLNNLELLIARDAQNIPVAQHIYIVDPDAHRARLLYSASQRLKTNESINSAFVGRANRLLHWEAILHYKRAGYMLYDLGGIDVADDQMAGINKFKLGFGAEILKESLFESYSTRVFTRLITGLKTMKTELCKLKQNDNKYDSKIFDQI